MGFYSSSGMTAAASAFMPIRVGSVVAIGTVALTAAPSVLVADDTRNNGARRVLVRNIDGAATAAVGFLQRGATPTLTLATGYQLPPGAEASFVVDCDVRIEAVASGACNVSVLVSDA